MGGAIALQGNSLPQPEACHRDARCAAL